MVTDWKKPRRVRASRLQWQRLRSKLGPCRLCEKPAASLHHLVPRSLGGDDVESNLVGLCGSGTTGCHGRIEAADATARCLLGVELRPDELAYVLRVKGPVFLRRYYGVELEVAA